MEIVKEILYCADKLKKEDLLPDNGVKGFIKYIDKYIMYATKPGIDLTQLQERDIIQSASYEYREQNAFADTVLRRSETCAVIHIHSTAISLLSKADIKLPPILNEIAELLGTTINVAKKYSNSDISIALKRKDACFIKDDGAICVGRSIYEAFNVALILEKAAKIFIYSTALGGACRIGRLDALYQHFISKRLRDDIEYCASHKIDVPSREYCEKELKVRQEICNCGKQLMKDRLEQGSWGNISARYKNKIITTACNFDYEQLTVDHCIKLKIEDIKKYKNQLIRPSKEAGLHAQIFKKRPDINAVIYAIPTYCAVFAATCRDLPVFKELPFLFSGGPIECAEYGLPGSKKIIQSTMVALESKYIAFMQNHGVVVCADSLSNALRNIEVLELACKEYIQTAFCNECGVDEFNEKLVEQLFMSTYKNYRRTPIGRK